MPTNILMPALSPTMTEGTLARWLKHEGDQVRTGDVIAEIETDKATMEIEATDDGVLGKILAPDGTAGVKVNAPIAVLLTEGEQATEGKVPAKEAEAGPDGEPEGAGEPPAQASEQEQSGAEPEESQAQEPGEPPA